MLHLHEVILDAQKRLEHLSFKNYKSLISSQRRAFSEARKRAFKLSNINLLKRQRLKNVPGFVSTLPSSFFHFFPDLVHMAQSVKGSSTSWAGLADWAPQDSFSLTCLTSAA
jgi:hypothetical protein